MKNIKPNWLLTIVVAVIVSLVPFLELWHTHTVYSGADMQFHINRVHELVSQIQAGNLSFIAMNSFNSVGSGVQYFYPNLTLIPAVLVFLVVKSSVTAYYVSLFIYGLITFAVAKYAFKKLISDEWLATLGTILFSLSAYHVFSVIGVSAFGEFIAIAWVPLIVLGYYRVVAGEGWKTIWISMVLMGYTHLLSLVLAVVILLGVTGLRFIINYKQVTSELFDYFKAVIAFIISFLAFVVPFLLLTKQNVILTPNATLHYDWAQTFAGYYVSSVRLLASRTLGFVFIILLAGKFFTWKYLSKNTRFVFWIAMAVTFVASSDFPWFVLVHTPIANLQFPYRFVPFAVALLTLAGIMAIHDWTTTVANDKLKKFVVIGLSLVTVATTLVSVHTYKNSSNATFKLETSVDGHLNYKPFAEYRVDDRTFNKQFNNHFDTYGAFDYWTETAAQNKKSISNHSVLAGAKTVKSTMTAHGANVTYAVENNKNQRLDLPFIQYIGVRYDVTVNGKKVNTTMSQRGTIEVPANKGKMLVVVQPKISTMIIMLWVVSLLGTLFIAFSRSGKKHAPLHVL